MNTFGKSFRISIFGESHGNMVGVLIDGCPAGIPLETADFQADIARRKPGSKGTTPRVESDIPHIETGLFNGFTTGAPILIRFINNNVRSKDYSQLKDQPRPGHADFTSKVKYGGFADYQGGGHFSGRLTLGLVAAGVLAKKIAAPLDIHAEIKEIGGATSFEEVLDKAVNEGDSLGGLIECRSKNMPVGLGEPFFDSLESMISHIIFSVPAIKGIEFGSGFMAAKMKGSQHNDSLMDENGTTATNNSGGINGGISNGNELIFRVAVKPTSSIGKSQSTYNMARKQVEELKISGRHDVCIALRMPVIVEAVTAIVLADLLLHSQQRPIIWKNNER